MSRGRGRTRAALAVAVAVSAGRLLALGAGAEFPFDRAQGTYENLDIEALPMQSGPLDLRLSSPENTVTLEHGSLRLEPAEDGLHKAMIQVVFSGEGRLLTEIKLGTIPSGFEDQVRFPRQEHRVTAWVTIAAEDEGYRVVAEELPETVQVELESALAADLVGFCRRMSLFFAGDAGCENLESMLSNPKIPLPEPGSDFLVRYADLTEAERGRLDLYLAGSKLVP